MPFKVSFAAVQEKPPGGDFEQLLAEYHTRVRATSAEASAPAPTGDQPTSSALPAGSAGNLSTCGIWA